MRKTTFFSLSQLWAFQRRFSSQTVKHFNRVLHLEGILSTNQTNWRTRRTIKIVGAIINAIFVSCFLLPLTAFWTTPGSNSMTLSWATCSKTVNASSFVTIFSIFWFLKTFDFWQLSSVHYWQTLGIGFTYQKLSKNESLQNNRNTKIYSMLGEWMFIF